MLARLRSSLEKGLLTIFFLAEDGRCKQDTGGVQVPVSLPESLPAVVALDESISYSSSSILLQAVSFRIMRLVLHIVESDIVLITYRS